MKKLTILFAVVLLSCQSQAPLTEADREAIKKTISNLSDGINNRSTESLNNVFMEDVISMPPNATENSGKQKVVEFHSNGTVTIVSFALTTVEVDGAGTMAFARGTWTFTGKMDTLQLSDNGKFLAVMKKEGDNWKIFRETWNTNIALPGN